MRKETVKVAKTNQHGAEQQNVAEDLKDYVPFIYELNGELIVFQCMSADYIMKCPRCRKETKYIVQHITKNPECQNYVNIERFKEQYNVYKKQKKLIDQNQRKSASRAAKRTIDN